MTHLERVKRQLGWPLISRALGANALRNVGIGAAVTAVVVSLNLAYYLSLISRPMHGLSHDEQKFVELGMDAVGGALDLQLMAVLAALLLLVAPTLACQNVIKEGATGTFDALSITPMSSLALHNGFAFGAIARLMPFLVAPMALHVGLGTLGLLDVGTSAASLVVLVVGSWSLSSFGTMSGALLKGKSKGPLAGLMLFMTLAIALYIPMLAVTENDPYLAGLSPASTILYTLANDSNLWLAALINPPTRNLVPNAVLGLPLNVTAIGLACAAFVGMVSTHAGRRRLGTQHTSLISFGASVIGALFVSTMTALFVGQAMASSWKVQTSGTFEATPDQTLALACIVMSLGLTWCIPAISALLPSRDMLLKSGVRSLVSGSVEASLDVGTGKLMALCSVPLLAGLAFPALSEWLVGPLALGWDWLFLLPVLWGLLGMTQLLKTWQFSSQKRWHSGLLVPAVFVQILMTLMISGAALAALTSPGSVGSPSTHSGPMDTMAMILVGCGMILLVSYLTMPLLFGVLQRRRHRNLKRCMAQRVSHCEAKAVVAKHRVQWPTRGEPVRELRVDLATSQTDPNITEAGARMPQTTLVLRDTYLEAHSRMGLESVVDLGRPFYVDAARGVAVESGGVPLSILVTQSEMTSASARVTFRVLAQPGDINLDLPALNSQAGFASERDAETLLHALQFYAELHGVSPARLHG